MADDRTWVIETVLDELDAILDRIATEDRREITPAMREAGREAMRRVFDERLSGDPSKAAAVRELGAEQIRAWVRTIAEPIWRAAVAPGRPS